MSRLSADREKEAGIAQVRRVATGILAGLTLVFAGTFAVADPPGWLLLVRAMAEAGMVGGLADWFAVEALFRHPLRLPIPHTALLPNNQQRAATNIARFIDEYFLVPDQLLDRLHALHPVRRLAEWLSHRDHAQMVARELSQLLQLIVQSQLRGGLGERATLVIRDLLINSVSPQDLARNLSTLLKEATNGEVLNEVLREVRNVVDQNRDKVTELVQENSRWWIASSVDKQIVRLLVDGILSTLDELVDEDSQLRQEFNGSITSFVDTFQSQGRIEAFIEQAKADYATSEEVTRALRTIVEAVLARLENSVTEHPEQAARFLAEAVQKFARMLLDQPEMEAQLEARLRSGLGTILHEVRPAIVTYISQVIAEWDSTELVERIEFEVGRDLQFIRINGAVLGAFVGGALFLITELPALWH